MESAWQKLSPVWSRDSRKFTGSAVARRKLTIIFRSRDVAILHRYRIIQLDCNLRDVVDRNEDGEVRLISRLPFCPRPARRPSSQLAGPERCERMCPWVGMDGRLEYCFS